jgi:cobalt-zinc-cadmium efflux system outer membrane protein
MLRLRFLLLAGPLLAAGCLYSGRERTDQAVSELAAHSFDLQPPSEPPPPARVGTESDAKRTQPGKSGIQTVGLTDNETTAFLQPAAPPPPDVKDFKERIKLPAAIPASETPIIKPPPDDEAGKLRAIRALYPPLPELSTAPTPEPGPNGQPYTLAALQQIAAENSPTLRQAASDVEAARGNMIQAGTYPNPTVGQEVDPSNDGSTAGVWGVFIDQTIKTFGKLRLAESAARMDLANAELALKKSRSDLTTQVRNNYFAVLVSKETVRVTRALAEFTDEVYRLQEKLLEVGSAAPYEPAALRAQAYSARLAYKQAIQTYIYNWKQLVAAVGLRQLPLSEVAGRIDTAIPYYDYDRVLAHALQNHTDVLSARNGIAKARYNLKLAQVTPLPDVDVRVAILKEFALAPEKYVHSLQVGIPLPIWDQNKGNILAAEAAMVRATEEPHRVELSLTNNLANAYTNYKTNLDGLEYYRRFILPDQVRAYRGVFERRGIDPGVVFGDLVSAQQTLAAGVTQYLTTLGQVWTSAIGVADLLQTDDLFQLAQLKEVPALPELDLLPCCHAGAGPVSSECVTVQQHTTPAPTEIKRMPLSNDQTQNTPFAGSRLSPIVELPVLVQPKTLPPNVPSVANPPVQPAVSKTESLPPGEWPAAFGNSGGGRPGQ